MKKIIIMIIMLFPLITYADVCDINKDTQAGNTGKLVCDDTKNTTTVFKTNNDTVVLSNSVCKITCNEEIVFMIQPIRKVLAGTSFSYPLYASGERKCTATYNDNNRDGIIDYEVKIKGLVSEYEALAEGAAKRTKLNEITNYYAEKKACDEFTKSGSDYENKYEFDSYDVKLDVETSKSVDEDIPYEFKELGEYNSSVILEEVSYNACDYNETAKKCNGSETTISSWKETARIYGKYTMKDRYMENYTGNTKETSEGKVCNVGDRYFTELNELSRPVANDPTDKGYKLTLTATNLDADFSEQARKNGVSPVARSISWGLNVDCWYQVKNIMFPQKGDENYDEYSGTGFQYRIIDVNNPFPDREAGANWKGKEALITSTSPMVRFEINLNRFGIGKIREYNEVHSYDTFDLEEMEKSTFIESNTDIIERK